ncbi:hypothetical protein CYMTET_55916 [Cymbomonas tetramitiformis]|uniref:Uncharacterized protein n=1 Tax=Cymbomonas tetramitiformis TaxID=36881 RepID=A0AAE0BD75_9CHLO|nr:hypothetical protein CYMTET_55916 [Cymbomonas tetramitiformis]
MLNNTKALRSGEQRKAMMTCNSAEDVYDKLMTEHSTIGVVGALTSGFAYAAFQSPPSTHKDLFGLFVISSALLNLASVCISTFLYIMYNVFPKATGKKIASRFFAVQPIATRLFLLGLACLAGGFNVYAYAEYGAPVFITSMICFAT